MAWELDSDRPIYLQIADIMESGIISGRYKPGEKLPSVRELAVEAGVTPNTVQRSYAELEKRGLVNTRRTSGRIVTQDENILKETRRSMAQEQIELFLNKMKELGFSSEEIRAIMDEFLEEGGKKNERE
ncbi:MAG: GntR family transcriptional regulator [Lachnospiraceae bacterium]|jgi:GntR family transcriptional regulator